MRARSVVKTALIVGLAVSGLTPAHAGQFVGRAFVARIAYAEVSLGNGGYAGAILEQTDGVDYDGGASALPFPPTFNPASYVGTPAGDAGAGSSRFLGCIVIQTKQGNDGQCADLGAKGNPENPKNLMQTCSHFPYPVSGCVLSPETLNLDPLLRTGTVTFSIESKIPGFEITANFGLVQDGNPSPMQDGAGANLSPVPPAAPPGPEWLTSDEVHGISQAAKVTLGTIRSDVLPGAAANIIGTKRAGMVVSTNELSAADLLHLFCTTDPAPPGGVFKPKTCYL